jgi:hypothetical protein
MAEKESSNQAADEIICESCSAKFACGATSGKCWCFGLEINTETLAKLKSEFRRCLCRQCLEKLSTTKIAQTTEKAITTNEI